MLMYRVMYSMRESTVLVNVDWDCKFFKFIVEIDQSEMTKSHMFNMSLKLINNKCLRAK